MQTLQSDQKKKGLERGSVFGKMQRQHVCRCDQDDHGAKFSDNCRGPLQGTYSEQKTRDPLVFSASIYEWKINCQAYNDHNIALQAATITQGHAVQGAPEIVLHMGRFIKTQRPLRTGEISVLTVHSILIHLAVSPQKHPNPPASFAIGTSCCLATRHSPCRKQRVYYLFPTFVFREVKHRFI